MLRSDLLLGLKKVSDCVLETKLVEALVGMLSQPNPTATSKAPALEKFMVALHIFDGFYAQFGDVEKEIIKIIGIEELASVAWRTSAIATSFEQTQDSMQKLHAIVGPVYGNMIGSLPTINKLASLLERTGDSSISLVSTESISGGNDYLTLILPDIEGQTSSAKRVAKAIGSIGMLYQTCADLQKIDQNQIIMISCDSGSNKVFDFKGLGSIIKEVKELILSLWDRVVFYKHLEAKAKLDTIKESLPIFEKINTLKADGTISPELALLMGRRVTEAISGFVTSSSLIPEIQAAYQTSPEKMLQSQTLLISSPEIKTESSSDKRKVKATPSADKKVTSSSRVTKNVGGSKIGK